MKLEIYTRIRDYPNYAVSNFGNVLNIRRQLFLRQYQNGKGYNTVGLCKNGKEKKYHIHRLIAEHFIPNPDNLPVIDHIDGNRTNNEISNLRWATHQTNSQNRKKAKNTSSEFKGIGFDKKYNKWVSRISINYKTNFIGIYSTEIEAAFAYNEYLIKHNLEDFPMNEI